MKRGNHRDVMRTIWLWGPATFLVIATVTIPLLVILIYSFLTPENYGGVRWIFSDQAWRALFLKKDIFDEKIYISLNNIFVLLRSLGLSLVTTVLTLAIGFPTAYYIATRDARIRTTLLLLITIPFWTNLLIRTFAIMEIIRVEGVLNKILLYMNIIQNPIHIMYTNLSVLIGMVYVFLPLMIIPIYSSLEKMDLRLSEAAYDLYASKMDVIRYIIFPSAKSGIVAGSILVFIPALGAYVTPRVLGGGTSQMIGNLIAEQFGQAANWPFGAALAISLMIVVGVLLFTYLRYAESSGARK